jgi:ABC-type ATPase with predicted acetyltransferase domain
VYAVTLLAILLFAISFHSGLSIVWLHHPAAQQTKALRLYFSADSGRVRIFFDPATEVLSIPPTLTLPMEHFELRRYRVDERNMVYRMIVSKRRAWWAAPVGQPERPNVVYASKSRIWDLPFAYILPVLIGSSLWMYVRRERRYAEGSCQSCGYAIEGLVNEVCPECGVQRG